MGQGQSQMQVLALILLVISTLVVQEIIHLSAILSKKKSRSSLRHPLKADEAPASEKYSTSTEETESLLAEDTESTSKVTDEGDTVEMGAEKADDRGKGYDDARRRLAMGVIPALFASLLSGLGEWPFVPCAVSTPTVI